MNNEITNTVKFVAGTTLDLKQVVILLNSELGNNCQNGLTTSVLIQTVLLSPSSTENKTK